MGMVIPDAIEPVVGWRCFDIVDGLLVSPQKRMPWPVAKKARATCSAARWHYEWVQATPEELLFIEAEAAAGGFTAEVGHYVKFLMPDGEIEEVSVYMPFGMRNSVPAVRSYPEPGKSWVLRLHEEGHPSPDDHCHCGIHLASDLPHALQYRGHNKHAAIGRVKGWGKVIQGTRGARVEFAYPVQLYLFSPPEGELDLSHYEVPIASVLECPEYLDSIGVTWR